MKNFTIFEVPFSHPRSFLKVTTTGRDSDRPMIATSRRRAFQELTPIRYAHDLYEVQIMYEGEVQRVRIEHDPAMLRLVTSRGAVGVVFHDEDELLIEADAGLVVRLLPCKRPDMVFAPAEGVVRVFDHHSQSFHDHMAGEGTRLRRVVGTDLEAMNLYDPAMEFASEGSTPVRAMLRVTGTECGMREKLPDFASTVKARQEEYARWKALMPAVGEEYEEASAIAWHILFNCQVPPRGQYTRTAILMSKCWMNQIWAWDNCFNALAVAKADPQLAFDQILLFCDHQAANGMFPDLVNDFEACHGFMKPPVYGWTVSKLMKMLSVETCRPFIEEAYEPLCRLTEWWYTYRDTDGDGMCQYAHGFDSGWDNATAFDQGYPTEGADLAAHLILQMQGLAQMADALGRTGEGGGWRDRADKQFQVLMKHSVREGRFFSPLDGRSTAAPNQSLLDRLPIILGSKLPSPILKNLVADLSPGGPFLTPFGPATESPQSAKYQSDGYWRGPIWAPSTYLIVDGLIRAGEDVLAAEIAKRFCDMAANEPAMYENYDALTGKGLRCPGYSWTSAVFVLLANWLGERARG